MNSDASREERNVSYTMSLDNTDDVHILRDGRRVSVDNTCLHIGEVLVLPDGRRAEVYTRLLRGTEVLADYEESDAVVKLSCIRQGTDVLLFAAVNLEMKLVWPIGWYPKAKFLAEGHEVANGRIGLRYTMLYSLDELPGFSQRRSSGDVETNEQQEVN
jgi:hypothetical protein